jgi:adenylate kinase
MQVIILGPPGVGKGTQSLLIAEKLGLVHLSTGEILRRAVGEKTPLGLKAKENMENGKLVSDEIMVSIIRDEISKDGMKEKGFILDGFPRTLHQAIELEKIFVELGYDNIKIINIVADEEEIVKRLATRGRQDDSPEIIKHRLEVYESQTAPVTNYFSKKHPVCHIHGIGEIDRINANIIEALTGVKIKSAT